MSDGNETTVENAAKTEVSEKVRQAMDLIAGFSLKEASDLVKLMEKELGVTAAAPVAAVVAGPAAGGAEQADEPSEFDVVLTGFGDKKIAVVKEVRKITGLGLKEAKDAVDGVPTAIQEKVDKEKAEEVKKAVEEAGGTVEIKPAG